MCEPLVAELTAGVCAARVEANPQLGLLHHLEASFHARRLRRSCAGLLPSTSDLYEHVRVWFLSGKVTALKWQVEQAYIENRLKVLTLAQDYFAAKGMLPEMTSFLWGKLAYEEDVRFRTIPTATRVDVKGIPETGKIQLIVHPLPEIAYKTTVSWEGTPEELAKRCRQALRKIKEARRFVYSSRQRKLGQVRPSIILSKEFLQNLDKRNAGLGAGVVLFPRHFLTPEPCVPMAELVSLAGSLPRGGTTTEINSSQDRDRQVVFYLPSIVPMLERQVSAGTYRKKLEELDNWQTILGDLGFATTNEDPAAAALMMRVRAEAVLEADAWDALMDHDGSQTVSALCERLYSKLPELRHAWGRSITDTQPSTYQLEKFFREVDADFLLLGLNPQARTTIDAAARQWAVKCDEMIAAAYWPENKLDFPRVSALVSAQFRSAIEANKDVVKSLCDEMRTKFQKNSKFVLRAVVENLQRCVLAGLPPVAISVSRESEVLARWVQFVKKRLNGYLAKELNRQDTPAGTMAEFEDAGGESDDLIEVEEICHAIQEIYQKEPSAAALQMFVELAVQAPSESWSSALAQPKILSLTPKLRGKISEAIVFCRQRNAAHKLPALSVADQEKLASILRCR